MKARGNRLLVWALAISVAVHVAVATALHVSKVEAATEQPPQRTDIVHIVMSPPPPTPVPTPEPHVRAHAPHHAAVARAHVDVPVLHENSDDPAAPVAGPVQTGGPAVDGDGSASPSPSPKPACQTPDRPASTIDAVSPNAPDDAAGVRGTTEVQVTLDAAGRVLDARVYRSSDDMRLDGAAVIAARRSTYAPALVDCQPQGGTYLFRVDFEQ